MNTGILGDFQICISVPLKKSHAEQTFLLLCLKRDHWQTSKVATAKDIFSSVYVIVTICFDKGFLFHVTTGRHRFPWGLFKRHATLFETSDLKEVQKQRLADLLQNSRSKTFYNIHRNHLCWNLFSIEDLRWLLLEVRFFFKSPQ